MNFSFGVYRIIQDLFSVGNTGNAWENALEGLRSFTEWRELVPLLLNVPLAVLLVVPLIYARRRGKRVHDLSTVEDDRALLLYAAVSAAIAVLVLEHPAMALVVFGMGGLLRFRPKASPGVATGRAIFSVVIGLACGLGMYPLGLLLAIMGLFGTRLFGSRSAVEITVKKLDPARIEHAQQAYHHLLQEAGCIVLGVTPSAAGDGLVIVTVLPERLAPNDLNDAVFQRIPKDLRGRVRLDQGV